MSMPDVTDGRTDGLTDGETADRCFALSAMQTARVESKRQRELIVHSPLVS